MQLWDSICTCWSIWNLLRWFGKFRYQMCRKHHVTVMICSFLCGHMQVCDILWPLFFKGLLLIWTLSFALFLLSMFPFGCNVMAKLLCSRILFSRGKQKVYKFGFSLTWPSPLYMPKRASSGSWQNLLLSTKSIPLSSTYFVASLKDIIVMIRPL